VSVDEDRFKRSHIAIGRVAEGAPKCPSMRIVSSGVTADTEFGDQAIILVSVDEDRFKRSHGQRDDLEGQPAECPSMRIVSSGVTLGWPEPVEVDSGCPSMRIVSSGVTGKGMLGAAWEGLCPSMRIVSSGVTGTGWARHNAGALVSVDEDRFKRSHRSDQQRSQSLPRVSVDEDRFKRSHLGERVDTVLKRECPSMRIVSSGVTAS